MYRQRKDEYHIICYRYGFVLLRYMYSDKLSGTCLAVNR